MIYPFLIDPKNNKDKDKDSFEFEYAYVEDFPFDMPDKEKKIEEEPSERGIVIIEM